MLQFARPINDRVFAAIKEQAKPLFPDNKIMVVEGDIELKVLRSDKCAAEG